MKICGVEIKASEAIFAVVSQRDTHFEHIAVGVKKLGLEDDDRAENVRAFARQLRALIKDSGIERIAIKKRSKKGEFAGGPTTFKIEGIFQLLDDCEVTLMSPQTISAQHKKHDFVMPASLNKYQHEAYKAACAALMKG